MRDTRTSRRTGAHPEKITGKIYAVMAVTTALTFASLTTGYQLLFPPHAMIA